MSKHHHQGKAEQVYNKANGATPFHHQKMDYEVSEPMKQERNVNNRKEKR